MSFNVGNIVTRDGTDEQLVLEVYNDSECITVKCIKEPIAKWCKLGDEEFNLSRRYDFVRVKE